MRASDAWLAWRLLDAAQDHAARSRYAEERRRAPRPEMVARTSDYARPRIIQVRVESFVYL